MAERLIDAEALKHKRVIAIYGNLEQGLEEREAVYVEDIDNAPTIEAKPVVHAHWEIEYDEDDNIKKCYCSNCGVGCEPMNYCGFCGAQMDELVSKTDELNSSVKIPVISMEDVPKLAKEMENNV